MPARFPPDPPENAPFFASITLFHATFAQTPQAVFAAAATPAFQPSGAGLLLAKRDDALAAQLPQDLLQRGLIQARLIRRCQPIQQRPSIAFPIDERQQLIQPHR